MEVEQNSVESISSTNKCKCNFCKTHNQCTICNGVGLIRPTMAQCTSCNSPEVRLPYEPCEKCDGSGSIKKMNPNEFKKK